MRTEHSLHEWGPHVNGRAWHPVPTIKRTFTGLLNDEFSRLDVKYPGCLPDLRYARTLLIGSDYSGESSDSRYLVFSFLLTDFGSWTRWEPKRLNVRQAHLTDARRMSFKRLSDGQRQRALLPFLEAANELDGLSFTIALSKRCASIFDTSPPLDLSHPDFADFRKWKPAVLDKAFLILHVLGVLLGGLAGPNQNVIWFTDEDSISANDDRVRELTKLFAGISSQYLEFDLGHLRCGTSKSDDGSGQIEDFLAIPDLIAGAIAEQVRINSESQLGASRVFWVQHGEFSNKTSEILRWFANSRRPLRRLLCIVDPASNESEHLLSWYHFCDQSFS